MKQKKQAKILCPVCNSKNTRECYLGSDILYRAVKGKFEICRCGDCAAEFIDPFPSREQTQAFYPNDYYSYCDDRDGREGFFDRIKNNIVRIKFEPNTKLTHLERFFVTIFKNKFSGIPLCKKKNGAFLDIGCGTGDNLLKLNKYGWKTYGIELDEVAVRKARSLRLNVEKKSIEDADFGSLKFDSIRLWHVLEHIVNPNNVISKITRLLKDTGELLIAVPNTKSFASKIFRQDWYNLDVPRHVVNYSPRTLKYLFSKHGLQITEIKYASCGFFPGSLSNFLRRKFGFKGNLVNNLFLIAIFSPLDLMSDFLKRGDIIFLKVRKAR